MESLKNKEPPSHKNNDKKIAKKKPKLEDTSPHAINVQPGFTLSGKPQCAYYLPNKRRCCNLEALPESKFCATHKLQNGENKRIQCPIDPRHSIYEKDLEKHTSKKCPMLKILQQQQQAKYFKQNVNFPVWDTCNNAALPSISTEEPSEDHEDLSVPQKLKKVQQASELSLLPDKSLAELIMKIQEAYEKVIVSAFPTEILSHNHFEHLLQQSSHHNTKHLLQESSLVGHIQKHNLLSPDNIFVEFGCGKGKLSFEIRQILLALNSGTPEHVLVDRQTNFKNRADKHLFDKPSSWQRISIDIKDLYLGGVDAVAQNPEKKIVCFSKHLCGPATDLAIHALTRTLCYKDEQTRPFHGLFVANCCHHRCQWECYTNKPFFEKLNFTKDDFKLICLMTSWAVCNSNVTHTEEKLVATSELTVENLTTLLSKDSLPPEMKSQLGFKCKRLIEFGRVEYLQELGYNASLSYFVDTSATPENCLLSAVRDEKK